MPYSQVEQVISEIRCIRKNFDIDECIVKEKIQEADDYINGYLGKVYIVPFQCNDIKNVPRLVNQISKKLATSFYVEWIFEAKSSSSAGLTSSSIVYEKYTKLLKEMIARKDAMPVLFCELKPGVGMNAEGGYDFETTDDSSEEEFSDLGWSNTEDYVPTFDEGQYVEQEVDPDKIDDIESKKTS